MANKVAMYQEGEGLILKKSQERSAAKIGADPIEITAPAETPKNFMPVKKHNWPMSRKNAHIRMLFHLMGVFFAGNFRKMRHQKNKKIPPKIILISVMIKGVASLGANAWSVPLTLKQRALSMTNNTPFK